MTAGCITGDGSLCGSELLLVWMCVHFSFELKSLSFRPDTLLQHPLRAMYLPPDVLNAVIFLDVAKVCTCACTYFLTMNNVFVLKFVKLTPYYRYTNMISLFVGLCRSIIDDQPIDDLKTEKGVSKPSVSATVLCV